MDTSPLVRAVGAYTARTLPELLRLGPATSALAPWMLAALVAPAASADEREAIEDALGLEAGQASREAGRLLGGGPEPLRAAVALWRSGLLATGGDLGRWEASIPEGAARGAIPAQGVADAWTREQTLGLIERFPVAITPARLCVLAAAIATRVSWVDPLRVLPAPPNAWGVGRMLEAEARGVVETPVGRVGVAAAVSGDGVAVYSFIADVGVRCDDLAATATRLVAAWDVDQRHPGWIPAGTLPPEGHAWTITTGYGGGEAVVPAFEERVEGADISGLAGIREAVGVLSHLVGDAAPPDARPVEVDAAMSSMARYDRRGFEAAAVATLAARPQSIQPPGPILHLRFDRPHLVIAVCTDQAFAGLPLFAAWVDAGVREPEPE